MSYASHFVYPPPPSLTAATYCVWPTSMYKVMNAAEEFNSALSPLGIEQATGLAAGGAALGRPLAEEVELVVSSSLRRAIHTAALVFPLAEGYPRPIVCLDETREFAGPPTSEKRHRRSEIHQLLSSTVDVLSDAATEVRVAPRFPQPLRD